MGKPNILYVHSHDTGRYVKPYGFDVPTPNIQKLAEEGVLFRKAFCSAPQCSPSRATLLTGQMPHSCGQFGLVNRGFELRDRHKHLAYTLKSVGYHTEVIGCHHVVRDPLTCGYDHYVDTRRRVGTITDIDSETAAEAKKFLESPPTKPFFLSVGFFSTHRRYPEPGPEDDPRYCQPPIPIPDTPEARRDMAAYTASVRVLDKCVGKVMKALESEGISEDTLVICTTDHGISFPKMKCYMTDHGIGVMLIIRGPSGFAGGKVIDALTSQIDLYPTLCDLLGVDPPDWLEGRSIMPVMNGEADEVNECVFAEMNYHAAYEPIRAVRTKRWKYIRRFGEYRKPIPSNVDEGLGKELFLTHGWTEQTLPAEEMYDLVFDPTESCNVAGKPEFQTVLSEMRQRLDEQMKNTDDPILLGPIPLPAGAFVSEPTDRSYLDIWKRVKRPEGYG